MHKWLENAIARLPLQFRVLYRQFLLRVIDLEALSIQADVAQFIGQFAGVLLMLSFIFAGQLVYPTLFMDKAHTHVFLRGVALQMEQRLIDTTLLVTGLFAVVSWDATFPDRRDIMVLSPLPVRPRTMLFAKIFACATVLGVAAISLNLPAGIVFSLLLGSLRGSFWGVLRFCVAYFFTVGAASGFLYGAVLTVQGVASLLFARRHFLRLSAVLQLAAFGLFVSGYFIEPSTPDFAALSRSQNHWFVACSPSYWFLAMMNQLNGALPPELHWLALRAWIGLGAAICGAVLALLLCYMRTMKQTVEEPDLVPGSHGGNWALRVGGALNTAIVAFSIRTLMRSRQHRVAFAFYWALVLSIALACLRGELFATAQRPRPAVFFIPTILMMALSIFGLRSVFALPISLRANWVLRTTQLRGPERYIAATRRTLHLLALAPALILSALLLLPLKPAHEAEAHLVVVALFGLVCAELSLVSFHIVPFTCSYLPGKVNIQLLFWGGGVVSMVVAMSIAELERGAFTSVAGTAAMWAFFAALGIGLWLFNRHIAHSSVLYFEELPEEPITTLRLILAQPSSAGNPVDPSRVHSGNAGGA